MIYIILFFIATILYVIKTNYFVLFINLLSYIFAIIYYFLKLKKNKIVNKNLNLVFNNISFIRKQSIIINCYKNFIFNVIVVLLQYIFGDSFLHKYYSKKSFKIYKKIQLILCHFGMFYDPSTISKLFDKRVSCVYKGNFDFYINKNIKMFQHNKINFNELYKYDIIGTPIDRKSNNLPKVYFLKQETKFHNKLVKYSLLNNRDLYFYFVKINWNSLEVKIEKLEVKNKELKDIIQLIADKMTEIIFNNPEQYLWNYNRFNLKV